jgi:cytoskeletal protein RodZ
MSYSTKKRLAKKSPSRRRLIEFMIIAIAAIIILLVALQLTHVIHLFDSAPTKAVIPTTSVHSAANSSGKAKSSTRTSTTSTTTAPSGSSSTSSKEGPTSSTSTTSAPLVAPEGSFVSNHHPGQNGSPTTEVSVCNTTPGATCYIQFTNGSYTRTLASQIADSEGTVTWNWDVSNPAFPAGSWQITAIATLNGQTKTTSDSQTLEVQ